MYRVIFLTSALLLSFAGAKATAQKEVSGEHEIDARDANIRTYSAVEIQSIEAASYQAAKDSQTEFFRPPIIRSSGGGLSTELVAKYHDHTIGSDSVKLRTYNRGLLGPTLLIEPGDLLHVRLRNELPAGKDPLKPDHMNITNLHTHGLQVSPEGNSDNIFLAIRPEGIFDYEFQLPQWHLPGTHWYHAHNHGSTAIQVASGMAGALLIKGGLDNVREIQKADDLLFFMQQFPYDDNGRIENTSQITSWRQLQIDKGRETTINGKLHPVLKMRPGEVQRWRFVHAGIADILDLTIRDQSPTPVTLEMHEIAADGIPLGRLRTTVRLLLGPGYRSEVLVKAPSSGGPFYLVDLKSVAGLSFQRDQPKTDRVLMRIELTGTPNDMPLPTDAALAALPRPEPVEAEKPAATQTIKFWGGDSDRKSQINGKEFAAHVTDVISRVGRVELWKLTTDTSAPVNALHPFHIHVNPFWAPLEDPESGETYFAWKDTLLVKEGPATIDVKIRFHRDFPGKTVFHCHRLDHEDNGMMSVVRIEDAIPKPADCTTATAVLPKPAPKWKLSDVEGIAHSSEDFRGKPHLLVLLRGFDCPHCLGQVAMLRRQYESFDRLGCQIVLVSTESHADLKQVLASYQEKLPFLILPDVNRTLYKAYDCLTDSSGGVNHGIFVIDEAQNIRWSRISEEAILDEKLVLAACERYSSTSR